ncbi:MAG: nitroreductase family protein [Simkaniaceae bacterium]|nr:nitroreductase family protein [Simkaniaceae bacterium]
MDEKHTDYPINSLILNRWSPRSMTGEPLTDAELMPLFEAARWAPSAFNEQPWRFIYAKRDTPEWTPLFDLLVDFNKGWCVHAACLVLFISSRSFAKNGKPSPTHEFDTGAAWMNLCLEASYQGLVAHGMSGFDYEKARKTLNIPEEYTILAMCAIGKRDVEKEKTEKPSTRKPLQELLMHGSFQRT